MMSQKEIQRAKWIAEQSVSAWMLTMEMARDRGDFDQAAAAQRKLRTMGVAVNYADADPMIQYTVTALHESAHAIVSELNGMRVVGLQIACGNGDERGACRVELSDASDIGTCGREMQAIIAGPIAGRIYEQFELYGPENVTDESVNQIAFDATKDLLEKSNGCLSDHVELIKTYLRATGATTLSGPVFADATHGYAKKVTALLLKNWPAVVELARLAGKFKPVTGSEVRALMRSHGLKPYFAHRLETKTQAKPKAKQLSAGGLKRAYMVVPSRAAQ